MTVDKFTDLRLAPEIQQALKEVGYVNPTPIQSQTIPWVLEGHDIMGIAQTGTGKTAAFCLPMIHNLSQAKVRRQPRTPRSLILTPTRELAIQIHQSLESYGKNSSQKYAVIFGGVSQNRQVRDMKNGVDVLVATPGRLLDLIQQKFITLNGVETFVLDEADRMLDMGFAKDIQRIIGKLPERRHNLFFSATMPKEIQKMAGDLLTNPKKIEVTPPATTVEKINQQVLFVEKSNKVKLLKQLLKEFENSKTLVFVEMKYAANRVAESLQKSDISVAVIHGNKSQGARQRAIDDFSKDKVKVLIATDIASRGIDIEGITHVINFQLSNIAESYVHRIGRTARAGRTGVAISFVSGEERSFLAHIEKTTCQKIPVNRDHPFHSEEAEEAPILKVSKAKAAIEKSRKKDLNAAYAQRRPPSKGKKKGMRANERSSSKKTFGRSSDSSKGSSSSIEDSRTGNKFKSKKKRQFFSRPK